VSAPGEAGAAQRNTAADDWPPALRLTPRALPLGAGPDGDLKVAQSAQQKPFMRVGDPSTAGNDAVQRLYEQSGSASQIAYLLLAAAKPLTGAPGAYVQGDALAV
jgi:hypothetical protein